LEGLLDFLSQRYWPFSFSYSPRSKEIRADHNPVVLLVIIGLIKRA
jgi:hypothetical protein